MADTLNNNANPAQQPPASNSTKAPPPQAMALSSPPVDTATTAAQAKTPDSPTPDEPAMGFLQKKASTFIQQIEENLKNEKDPWMQMLAELEIRAWKNIESGRTSWKDGFKRLKSKFINEESSDKKEETESKKESLDDKEKTKLKALSIVKDKVTDGLKTIGTEAQKLFEKDSSTLKAIDNKLGEAKELIKSWFNVPSPRVSKDIKGEKEIEMTDMSSIEPPKPR